MPNFDWFSKGVFPAELTEIYRRRQKVLPEHPIESVQSSVEELDKAEKELRDAEERVREARAKHYIRRWAHRYWRVQAIEEAEKLAAQRRAVLNKTRLELGDQMPPSVKLGLVGLAFSGGGIRSATFNLGILQGLADFGLLRFFDYLSTVSGGGYIGSWFTAWIWHERENPRGGLATVGTQLRPALSAREGEAKNAPPSVTVGEVPPVSGPDPIFHVRRYSEYIKPRFRLFSQDTWSKIAIDLRNSILIQLILITGSAVVILVPRILVKGFYETSSEFNIWSALLMLIFLAGIVLVSISSALSRLRQPPGQHFQLRDLQMWIYIPAIAAAFIFSWLFGAQRESLERLEPLGWMLRPLVGSDGHSFLYWGLALGGLNVVAYLISIFVHSGAKFHGIRMASDFISGFVGGALLYALLYVALWNWAAQDRMWDVISFGPPVFLIIFLLANIVQVGLRSVTESDAARAWQAGMAAWLLISALSWAGLFALSFYIPLFVPSITKSFIKLLGTEGMIGLLIGWIITLFVTIERSQKEKIQTIKRWITTVLQVTAVIGLLIEIAFFASSIVNILSPPPPVLSTNAQLQTSPPSASGQEIVQAELQGTVQLNAEQIKVEMNLKSKQALNGNAIAKIYWAGVRRSDLGTLTALLGFCLLVASVLAYRVDINEFSRHAFYRNRLVRCYLGASRGKQRDPDPITGFDPGDDFPLANLRHGPDYQAGRCYDGPYLIINTALNQMAGRELAWQKHKTSSFILTPRFCGSGETGYRETEDFCGGMELGTAFAISGVTVSPNISYQRSGAIAFVQTLFNVRLGWWIPNPKKGGLQGRQRPVRLHYLLTELFGQTTVDSNYVYLSDGGHFENLGIYELVRRRCKYIVCCDAGADPQVTFEDLGNAIRKIRAELGVSIEIDLDMIRPEAGQRYSRWHQAIGVIRYDEVDADESVGLLVYIKASLTGDEPADVLEHAGRHLLFPHDPAADEQFNESQFESYRKLGEHVAWQVFHSAQGEVQNGAVAVFNALHHWLSAPPGIQDSFLAHKDAFVRLEAKLCDDPQLAKYDAEIYPELIGILGASPTASQSHDERAELHFCNMQLQLMENVFLALNLQKYHSNALNRGWMNLFRRWAMTQTFQKLWPGLRGGYSRQFDEFVEEHFIPCAPFQIVPGIPAEALVQRLLDEFKRDQLSMTISPHVAELLQNPAITAWSAVPGSGPPVETWGVAVVNQEPGAQDCQLFVWVRGAYRNLGMGGALLDRALSEIKTKGFKGKISVDLGEDKPGSPSHQQRKGAWLRLYGKHGFIREFGDAKRLRLALRL